MQRLLRLWALALPIAAGVVLRLWNLPRQVLGGDEFHALRAAQGTPFPDVLVAYRTADPSLPFAGLVRLFLDLGFPFSELVMRMPSLVAGVAALGVLPLLASRRLGRRGAIVFAWLLAISPMLILYSRIARPYMPIAFLTPVALFAFDRFWPPGECTSRIPTWTMLYAVAAALAVYFHPIAAPAVLAPLGFACVEIAVRRRADRPSLVRLASATGGLLLLVSCFLIPAARSLAKVMSTKSGAGQLHLEGLAGSSILLSGSVRMPMTVCFWFLVLSGLIVLSRRQPRFALYGLTLAAGQIAALVLVDPLGIGSPLIFSRYLIHLLPVILLWAAVPIGAVWERLSTSRWPAAGGALVSVVMFAVFASGPFTDMTYLTSSFVHNNNFLLFYRSRPVVPPHRVPSFYQSIPDSGGLVEFPWPSAWSPCRSIPTYQELHRRRVIVSSHEGALQDPRLAFRNLVPPTPAGFLASDARYVVIHRDLAREERSLVYSGANWDRIPTAQAQRLSRVAAHLASELNEQWGPPLYADSTILVWDLETVRSVEASAPSTVRRGNG